MTSKVKKNFKNSVKIWNITRISSKFSQALCSRLTSEVKIIISYFLSYMYKKSRIDQWPILFSENFLNETFYFFCHSRGTRYEGINFRYNPLFAGIFKVWKIYVRYIYLCTKNAFSSFALRLSKVKGKLSSNED